MCPKYNTENNHYEIDCTRKTLGRKVATLREQKGYSQRYFSAMIELDRAVLSDIENGKGNPTLKTLERIAEGLSTGLRDLFA